MDVDVHRETLENPVRLLLLLAPEHAAAEALGEPAVKREVVLSAELEHQPEVLMDEPKPVRHLVADGEETSVELGRRAAVRLVIAGQRLDQRRLPRAVLAHERVDLPGADVDADVLQRARGAERLR